MITCPKCDAAIDAEEDKLDEGDTISCDECGATVNVVSVNPVELEVSEDEDDEEDDEDEDFDFDEDEDEEEEEEEEEDAGWK